MILKNFNLDNIKNFQNKIFLFYGDNEGFKNDCILKIYNNNSKYNLLNYNEKEILENEDNFYFNITHASLFEENKIIIIKKATDRLLEIIDNIQEKKTENIIILNSDQLDKRSKLRSFFEKHKDYYCVAFYPDDQQTISKIIFNFLKKNNIKISPKDINLIVSKCNGDRLNLYNELNKIKSYVLNNSISSDVLRKLINLSEDYDLSKLVDNCLATNKKETLNILNENNFTNEDCLLIVRIFLQKSKRLLNLKKNYNKNQNLEFTISSAKPPIFWKDKDIVKKQIHNWNVENIKVLIYRLCKLELLLKKNINNSINLITNFLIDQLLIKN